MGSWGFVNVKMIVHTPSLPPLRGNKDPCKVEGLHPRFLAVVSTYLSQLLSQLNLGFFYSEIVKLLPRGLRSFLGHPSSDFGLLQLNFKVQDQLLLCGQLYLSEIELFALIFSLVLRILQPSLNAPPHPLFSSQLNGLLLVFLLHGSEGLVGLGAEVGLNPGLILSILNLFLSYKNLLGNLHKNEKGILCKKRKKEKREREWKGHHSI